MEQQNWLNMLIQVQDVAKNFESFKELLATAIRQMNMLELTKLVSLNNMTDLGFNDEQRLRDDDFSSPLRHG